MEEKKKELNVCFKMCNKKDAQKIFNHLSQKPDVYEKKIASNITRIIIGKSDILPTEMDFFLKDYSKLCKGMKDILKKQIKFEIQEIHNLKEENEELLNLINPAISKNRYMINKYNHLLPFSLLIKRASEYYFLRKRKSNLKEEINRGNIQSRNRNMESFLNYDQTRAFLQEVIKSVSKSEELNIIKLLLNDVFFSDSKKIKKVNKERSKMENQLKSLECSLHKEEYSVMRYSSRRTTLDSIRNLYSDESIKNGFISKISCCSPFWCAFF